MSHLSKTLSLLAAALLIALGSTTVSAQNHKSSDIVDTAVAAGSFNTLAAALTAANLIDVLKGEGPFTVFAPTDAAFAALPKGTVETLLKPENKDQLIAILTYHVVAGKVNAKSVMKLTVVETLNGQRVDIAVKGGEVMIDNATVRTADVAASNGIIHVIDQVILPTADAIPTVAANAGTFQTLLAAVKAAGLADVLSGPGPFTVLAPTDDAFAALPDGTVAELLKPENRAKLQAILKYHVIAGRVFSDAVVKLKTAPTLAGADIKVSVTHGSVKVNDANVVATDIDAANGVIHVIDAVLLPPADMSSVERANELINMAINRGAPLFNSGQASATVAIYELAANAVLSMDEIPDNAQRALRTGLREMNAAHGSESQAWAMRHALDDAYAMMKPVMTPQSSANGY
ncbi:MAG: fasciclin domain-containing protein [Rhodothermales bacterium]|nr:fasciclin domain-containing protein [Rhodothermales bacterium]